jgi:hypothetical protein
MTPWPEASRALRDLRERVATERRRAARAAEIAARHERLMAEDAPALSEFHRQAATTQRQVEQRHLAAARIHASCARRIYSWTERLEQPRALPLPALMTSVTKSAAAEGASVTLFAGDRVEVLTAASEGRARQAQDLESTLGEGPARDTMRTRRVLRATGAALRERWPTYGPEVARLGIGSLIAVPVELSQVRLGALTVYDPRSGTTRTPLEPMRAVAELIAVMMCFELDAAGSADGRPADPGSLFAQADLHDTVLQATGMVSAQTGCSTTDALALIRARAFAESTTVDAIADDVVSRRVSFA